MGSDKQVARLEKSGGRAGEGRVGQRGWGLSSVLCGESHSLSDGSLKSSEHFLESFIIRGIIIFRLGHLTMLFHRALAAWA